jgi:hypothetical protein
VDDLEGTVRPIEYAERTGDAGPRKIGVVMARTSSAMDVPFRANIGLLAQRHRRLLRDLTKRRLKRGVFCSVVDLQAAISRFLEEHNQQSKSFT